MRKKIFVCSPEAGMGTNFYRSTGPWSDLRRRKDIEIHYGDTIRWDHAAFYDIAFFLWPNTPRILETMGLFKAMGVPCWVDFDDDPWTLNPDNPAAEAYKPGGEVSKCIESACQEAEVVTVSTALLKPVFEKFNKNVHVINNGYQDNLWPFFKFPRKKCIVWRGALGHNDDLESVFPALVELQAKLPDVPIIFIGEPNKEILGLLKQEQTITIPYQHLQAYMRTLIDVAAPVQIMPITKTPFNMCKSNCSWLEATCAGSQLIAPAWHPEFQKPGIGLYEDCDDLVKKVIAALESPELREKNVEKSRFEIGKNYLVSKLNEKRIKFL